MNKCCQTCRDYNGGECDLLGVKFNPYLEFINPLIESGMIHEALEEDLSEEDIEKVNRFFMNKLDECVTMPFEPEDDRNFYCEKWR